MNVLLKRLNAAGDLPRTGTALDLGFGAGTDIDFLRNNGLDVVAVDSRAEAVEKAKSKYSSDSSVEIIESDVTDFKADKSRYSIVNCNNVLPFISNKESVKNVIKNVIESLEPEGYFCFTVFGEDDEWKDKENMSFWNYQDVLDIIDKLDCEIYFKSTEEGWGTTMKGDKKWWHIHKLILVKK